MKYLKFTLSLLLTALVFYGLNNKLGSIPPIGKFLNPYTGVWQNETDESITGTVSIDGLRDKVTVHYDAQLIPHLFAQNEMIYTGPRVILRPSIAFGKWNSRRMLPLVGYLK